MVKWDYKKKEKRVSYMLAPKKHFLDHSKVYSDVTGRWLLAWNQNKQVTYYIFYILIQNSVLIFIAIVQICYQQISIIRCYWLQNQPELLS